jgi:hypothetical protein
MGLPTLQSIIQSLTTLPHPAGGPSAPESEKPVPRSIVFKASLILLTSMLAGIATAAEQARSNSVIQIRTVQNLYPVQMPQVTTQVLSRILQHLTIHRRHQRWQPVTPRQQQSARSLIRLPVHPRHQARLL